MGLLEEIAKRYDLPVTIESLVRLYVYISPDFPNHGSGTRAVAVALLAGKGEKE